MFGEIGDTRIRKLKYGDGAVRYAVDVYDADDYGCMWFSRGGIHQTLEEAQKAAAKHAEIVKSETVVHSEVVG